MNFSCVYVGITKAIPWQICQSWHAINLGYVLDTLCKFKNVNNVSILTVGNRKFQKTMPISTKNPELPTDSSQHLWRQTVWQNYKTLKFLRFFSYNFFTRVEMFNFNQLKMFKFVRTTKLTCFCPMHSWFFIKFIPSFVDTMWSTVESKHFDSELATFSATFDIR